VRTELGLADRLGGWKVRWTIGRKSYAVEPGLYAVGEPGPDSPVLVSANYKLSFDLLRSSLGGLDAWLLVLDTRGVNVWCAAGKGTFGTDEIVNRVQACGLEQVVRHRTLVLPQLGAPGVKAHEVKQRSGFRVVYGPVHAPDIKAFLAARMQATPEMRRVRFPAHARARLIPAELVGSAGYALLAALLLAALTGLTLDGGYSLGRLQAEAPMVMLCFALTWLAGVILPPLLLPWLPGRAFFVKGIWAGLLAGGAIALLGSASSVFSHSRIAGWAWLLLSAAVASFLAMNFTGCSTYTSLSGVRAEMKRALPFQIATAAVGLLLWVAGRLV
jgi:acetyl-CoA decarbonylase/synthase complex subunit gamma